MSRKRFEELINALPEMAKAVNHFKSPEAQREAFSAVLQAWREDSLPEGAAPRPSKKAAPAPKDKAGPKAKGGGKSPSPARKRSGNSTPSLVKDLNLRPDNDPAFETFVAEKNPTSNHERNVVAVYYLEKVLDLDAVSLDHVFTCYRDRSWRIPSDLRNSVALTASRKGWLDSSDSNDLRVTAHGLNAVEHDLPSTGKDQ